MSGKIIPLDINKTRAVEGATSVFGGLHTVIWEYIVNSIDYLDEGTKPLVEVQMNKINNTITISDNGRGMNIYDLKNFMTVYAENRDRKDGTYTFLKRGYFGTGGFSAYKHAKKLEIQSVKNGKLYEGHMTKEAWQNDIGFTLVTEGKKTDLENGTKFVISELLKPLDHKNINDTKEFAKKHMRSKVYSTAQVYINEELIEYIEPPIEESMTKKINSKNSPFYDDLKDLNFGSGEIELTLKKTKKPLQRGEFGVSVIGDGIFLELTTSGIDTKKYANYIIGEAYIKDIHKNLEKFEPQLFDQSRKTELCIDNPYVPVMRSFIAKELNEFEQKVAEVEREREKKEFNKELEKKLSDISDKINQAIKSDWDKLNLSTLGNRNLSRKSKKDAVLKNMLGEIINPGDDFFKQKNDPLDRVKSDKKPPRQNNRKNSKKDQSNVKNNNSGGISIKLKSMGVEERRADFNEEQGLILINRDYPPIQKFIVKGDFNNEIFNALLKEIASTELAVATTAILINKGYYGSDMITAMVDLRNKVDQYSRILDNIK